MIKTARIGQKISGIAIDITVKGNKNHVLAPTWELVMAFKQGKINWEEYREKYFTILNKRLLTRRKEFDEIIETAKKVDVFLCCFCKNEERCHRSLAKQFLESLS